jgi:hypothetical protein
MDDRISAGELRGMGAKLDNEIPDCATVRRSAVRIVGMPRMAPASEADQAERMVKLHATLEITEPFSWVTVNVPISEPA